MDEWSHLYSHILEFEAQGLVTRTFRRLDPKRQQDIVMAILEEAIEKGPPALNIKQVAARAGVSVGSLYTYFNHREGLLDFVTELCTRFMQDSFESYTPLLAALPLHEALYSYLMGGVEWSKEQAGLVQFFVRAAYHGDAGLGERMVRPVASTMREMVRAILQAGIARGEVRADIDLESASRIIHALMIAVGDSMLLPYLNAYFQVDDAEPGSERLLATLLDLIEHGISSTQTNRDAVDPRDMTGIER
jgi:AcrR family transcriptional regulator